MKDEDKKIIERIAGHIINDEEGSLYTSEDIAKEAGITKEEIEQLFPGEYSSHNPEQKPNEETSYLNELLEEDGLKAGYLKNVSGDKVLLTMPIGERYENPLKKYARRLGNNIFRMYLNKGPDLFKGEDDVRTDNEVWETTFRNDKTEIFIKPVAEYEKTALKDGRKVDAEIVSDICKFSLQDIKRLARDYGGEGKVETKLVPPESGEEYELQEFSPRETKKEPRKDLRVEYAVNVEFPFGTMEDRIVYPINRMDHEFTPTIRLTKYQPELQLFLEELQILPPRKEQ